MCDQGFSFYRATANIHTYRDKVIAISAPPYYVVGEDNYCFNTWTNYVI